MQINTEKQPDKLGRLKSLGLSELWQVALLLPSRWDDMTSIVTDFSSHLENGNSYLLRGILSGSPSMRFVGTPRLVGYIADSGGRKIGFSLFGDSRVFQALLKDSADDLLLFGQIDLFNNSYWLKNPEVVHPRWVGRLRPVYPGKTRVINPDTVRERVGRALKDAIPVAANFLANELKSFGTREVLAGIVGLSEWSLEQILVQAHFPKTIENGRKSQLALDRLAALGIIAAAQGSKGESQLNSHTLMLGDWRHRSLKIPFDLTDEQKTAIIDTIADLKNPFSMRRILSGDVGTGKTAVYGTVAATVVDGFGTVVILLPNESLAKQVYREFTNWWPDIPIQLVTGSSKGNVAAPLVIGTTAALFRGTCVPDLVIVDEQQKFSREQREQLVGCETHQLEVTATCIPRSQALVRYGVLKVSKLTKCHTPKTIHTRIWQHNQWGEVSASIKTTIAAGDQVLYVYPLREKGEKPGVDDEEKPAGSKPELKSAGEVFEKWEKLYPGKARIIHGQMSDDEKTAALNDMLSGVASVLVATTVVEVGINLPKLRRVVVVHPERHGITTLHQIRGRVARLGGEGWCDLFLPYPVKPATLERLQVLEKTQDGFIVAEHDMRLRGIGDMSRGSDKQSGADMNFLFGRPVSIDSLDFVADYLHSRNSGNSSGG